jgi:hypothetical protein
VADTTAARPVVCSPTDRGTRFGALQMTSRGASCSCSFA